MIGKDRRKKVLKVPNLKEYFRDSVSAALESQNVCIEDQTAHYVVNLLTMFSRSEELYECTTDGFRLRPLAQMLSDALSCQAQHQQQLMLQRLGDISLFISGIFSYSLSRKLVDVDYYASMGGTAYSSLSSTMRGSSHAQALAEVFCELSERFVDVTDVLAEISKDAFSSNDSDILRLYELWLRTGSGRAENRLRQLGIMPSAAAITKYEH